MVLKTGRHTWCFSPTAKYGKVEVSKSPLYNAMTEFGQYAGALTFENFGQVEIQSSLWELAELQALREKKVLG